LLSPGSIVLFYRSDDLKAICNIGIVEGIIRSQNPKRIALFVGNRTVYSFAQIANLCRKPVLAILFRHVSRMIPNLSLQDLRVNGILTAAPQTIIELHGAKRGRVEKWLSV
jgi:hypothetical protein